MRLPAALRPSPSLRDVERGLLGELGRYRATQAQVPNAWVVTLSPRDCNRHAGELAEWSARLAESQLAEQRRWGLTTSGLVTVAFDTEPDVAPGSFRVLGTVVADPPLVIREKEPLPGHPRLTLPTGGSVRHGTPAAAGLEREVLLPAGAFVVGRGTDADLRVHDASMSPRHVELTVSEDRIRLRDLGSLNGTRVDGVPSVEVDLVDGNRIELGETTLTFHRDDVDDDGGREGGEGE